MEENLDNERMEEFILEQMEMNLDYVTTDLKNQLEELVNSSRRLDFSCRRLKTIDNNPECLEQMNSLLKKEKLESIILLLEATKKFAIELGNEDLTDKLNAIILEIRKEMIQMKSE